MESNLEVGGGRTGQKERKQGTGGEMRRRRKERMRGNTKKRKGNKRKERRETEAEGKGNERKGQEDKNEVKWWRKGKSHEGGKRNRAREKGMKKERWREKGGRNCTNNGRHIFQTIEVKGQQMTCQRSHDLLKVQFTYHLVSLAKHIMSGNESFHYSGKSVEVGHI